MFAYGVAGVFCVEVAPDGGIKSICIRGADGNTGGFLVANKCPAVQRVMVHTYHTEMHSQNSAFEGGSSVSSASSSRSRHSIKLPDFDFHFFANEGETVAYGWPFPFTYSSRPVRITQASRHLCLFPVNASHTARLNSYMFPRRSLPKFLHLKRFECFSC